MQTLTVSPEIWVLGSFKCPVLLSLKECLLGGNLQANGYCNLSSQSVEIDCFVFEVNLSEWSCCYWIGWGHQPFAAFQIAPFKTSLSPCSPLVEVFHEDMWLEVTKLSGK
jgi:hypothetical protein